MKQTPPFANASSDYQRLSLRSHQPAEFPPSLFHSTRPAQRPPSSIRRRMVVLLPPTLSVHPSLPRPHAPPCPLPSRLCDLEAVQEFLSYCLLTRAGKKKNIFLVATMTSSRFARSVSRNPSFNLATTQTSSTREEFLRDFLSAPSHRHFSRQSRLLYTSSSHNRTSARTMTYILLSTGSERPLPRALRVSPSDASGSVDNGEGDGGERGRFQLQLLLRRT
ncbi:hypothetical protein BXZ70DRAFT_190865 [Cristinia sonorae]|uniref:Uncharacterized protein n=1 Tax=Cristinia sonorae TaxID=1940300 RepID=A0A8K0XPK8_9AGAR|nr:hypothetical protein BXZ70DRAFT_190865 [Cristinia sonorae]